VTRAAGRHVPTTATLRRAALAACCIALGLTPAAGAQEAASDRTPLVGGGSFLTAPLIETGEYADTLLPAERLYYGVKLEPGQRLRVGAELDVAADKYGDYASGFSLGVQTPLREVDVLNAVDEDVAGNGSVTSVLDERLEYITPPVLSRSAAFDEVGVYRGPGTWYVSMFLTTSADRPRRIEFPVRLDVEVMGEPQPETEPEPTPASTPEPTPEEGSDDGDGGGTSLGAILGLGVLGLVVGLVGGAALGRRSGPA
jgi:hypothetical protein